MLACSIFSEESYVIEPFVLANDRDHFYFGIQTALISGEVMKKVSLAIYQGGKFNMVRRYAKDPLFIQRSLTEKTE